MPSYGKDHITWNIFSCFWNYMLCRKLKKNRFPINELDWLFPCSGCVWLTGPQKSIALSDATFSKFLETVITYWATAQFPVLFFENNFCNWFVWLQSYNSKTVDLKMFLSSFFPVPSPKWRFLLSLLSLSVILFDLWTCGHSFIPHLIDINWFDQQIIRHLTKVTTLWLGCYSERSQTQCSCDFFTKNKSST